MVIWFVVFFVVATPVVFIFNYFVIWFALVVETWGNPQVKPKPNTDFKEDLTEGLPSNPKDINYTLASGSFDPNLDPQDPPFERVRAAPSA